MSITTIPASTAPRVDRAQVDRAVSLTGRPTRALTGAELAAARRALTALGCTPAEIAWRLGGAR